MADEKTSALVENTTPISADNLLLIDNMAGTPVSQRISLLNLLGTIDFGSIGVAGGSASQSPGATYALCTQFTADGLSSPGVTPTVASNKITVVNTGIYLVGYSISYIGTNSATTAAVVFWNGVEQSQVAHQRTMGAAAAIGVAAQWGLVDVVTGATDFDLRIKTSSGIFDVKEMSLVVVRLGNT